MSVGHPIKQIVERMSNDELVEMLRREYLRKLTRYRFTDEFFRKRYGMTYEEFEKENRVARRLVNQAFFYFDIRNSVN